MTIKQLKDKYAVEKGYENWYDYLDYCNSNGFDESEIGYNDLIIFCTKYHVQKALKQASEKAFVEYIDLNTDEIFDYTDVITDDNVGANVNKESILNAYSLENIK